MRPLKPHGGGLGFALTREMASRHGGELRYVSRPGESPFRR
ncbi:hypothetical protein [Dyella sp. Tek66A03]